MSFHMIIINEFELPENVYVHDYTLEADLLVFCVQ